MLFGIICDKWKLLLRAMTESNSVLCLKVQLAFYRSFKTISQYRKVSADSHLTSKCNNLYTVSQSQ